VPTSAFTSALASTPLAGLGAARSLAFNQHLITPLSDCSIGAAMSGFIASNPVSGSYPSSNLAMAVPFEIAAPFLVRKVFWINGTTATTNSADCGVYTEAGARVVSGGGTAISGATQLQEVDVTDTLLKPGRYWLAYVQNGTTATPFTVATAATNLRSCGCAQMATAYVLPSTFTPAAAVTFSSIPLMGIASRTLAA
jgi:hypothetical protein